MHAHSQLGVQLYAYGITLKEVAEEVDAHYNTVRNILRYGKPGRKSDEVISVAHRLIEQKAKRRADACSRALLLVEDPAPPADDDDAQVAAILRDRQQR